MSERERGNRVIIIVAGKKAMQGINNQSKAEGKCKREKTSDIDENEHVLVGGEGRALCRKTEEGLWVPREKEVGKL